MSRIEELRREIAERDAEIAHLLQERGQRTSASPFVAMNVPNGYSLTCYPHYPTYSGAWE